MAILTVEYWGGAGDVALMQYTLPQSFIAFKSSPLSTDDIPWIWRVEILVSGCMVCVYSASEPRWPRRIHAGSNFGYIVF